MKSSDSRKYREKLNILIPPICQLLTLACGIIAPRLLIGHFGSEAYGATTSIAQFLSYITLLEGGIGGVARAALYKPLAENDSMSVSRVVSEVRRFFRIIACIFAAYVLVLACSFKGISGVEVFDWLGTFFLVAVISISTFAQYFIGISYTVLIQASQRRYVAASIAAAATVLNTIMVVILVNLGSSLIMVKLVSSIVFILRPVLSWLYVRRKFDLPPCSEKKTNYLKQKWSGLGQHIAYFLHSNTDVVVLTLLANLKTVAVYSVYNMVISSVQNLAISFLGGMEALFGDLLAKGEHDELNKTFSTYETLTSIITTIFFAATGALIIPFIRIYTAGISDANYIEPAFAIILTLACVAACLRTPYHNVVIAAGHFRQTQAAAYAEAAINVILSVILVIRFGLVGVAIGTLAATVFRTVYYVFYLSKHIIRRKISLFIKRTAINTLMIAALIFAGYRFSETFMPGNYAQWILCAVPVTIIAAAVTACVNFLFYPRETKSIVKMFRR